MLIFSRWELKIEYLIRNCSFENMKQLYIQPLFESFTDIYIHDEVYKELDENAKKMVDTYIGKMLQS